MYGVRSMLYIVNVRNASTDHSQSDAAEVRIIRVYL